VISGSLNVDQSGFVRVSAQLQNKGTSPINEFELMYQLTGAEKTKEKWNGYLPPDGIINFTFNRESFLESYEQTTAINCTKIISVNGKSDLNANNNLLCTAVKNEGNFVGDPFPNPSFDSFNIPVVLQDDQAVVFELQNALGEKLISHRYLCTEGLNLIALSAEKWNVGIYFLTIRLGNDEVFLKKLIKH